MRDFGMFYGRDGAPISYEEWTARYMEDRHVGSTYVYPDGHREDELYRPLPFGQDAATTDAAWVSTVWLGINHNFTPGGPPLIFESLVFGGDFDQEIGDRYFTLGEALAGHEMLVATVQRQMETLRAAADVVNTFEVSPHPSGGDDQEHGC